MGFTYNSIAAICIFITRDIECLYNHTWHAKERDKENKCLCDCNQNNHFAYDEMFGKLHLITASKAGGKSWATHWSDETARAVSQLQNNYA